jgi:hypothetical protein
VFFSLFLGGSSFLAIAGALRPTAGMPQDLIAVHPVGEANELFKQRRVVAGWRGVVARPIYL